ncbi:MAG: hypothetical protein J0I09_03890 [Sphingobacteriia bacterium]|nr:hypothetical protein [Sphingobacteriia bacterium]
MKQLFISFTCLIAISVFGQTDEIYRLTFRDTSNFRLTTLLDRKMPKMFVIIDTTEVWNGNRFWLNDFDNKNKENIIKQIQNDEHHPYFHSYLFSDPALDKIFPDKTKQELRDKSKSFKSKKIKLNGENYKTVSSSKRLRGFYFVTSEPIFSDDNNFAFIDMTVFYKDSDKQPFNETYFGSIALIFQKTGDSWTRIGKKDWLIL